MGDAKKDKEKTTFQVLEDLSEMNIFFSYLHSVFVIKSAMVTYYIE